MLAHMWATTQHTLSFNVLSFSIFVVIYVLYFSITLSRVIPGKGPNWTEPYDPNLSIDELIQSMTTAGLGDRKRIEIFKHEPGNLNKYDQNNPYWSHDTKLSEYVSSMGGLNGQYVQLTYCIV
jgi:hypothetical protein